jgi:hypothetical protein
MSGPFFAAEQGLKSVIYLKANSWSRGAGETLGYLIPLLLTFLHPSRYH